MHYIRHQSSTNNAEVPKLVEYRATVNAILPGMCSMTVTSTREHWSSYISGVRNSKSLSLKWVASSSCVAMQWRQGRKALKPSLKPPSKLAAGLLANPKARVPKRVVGTPPIWNVCPLSYRVRTKLLPRGMYPFSDGHFHAIYCDK